MVPVTGFPRWFVSVKLLAGPMQRMLASVPLITGCRCAEEVPENMRVDPVRVQSGCSVGSVIPSLSTMVISAAQVEPGVHVTPLMPRSST